MKQQISGVLRSAQKYHFSVAQIYPFCLAIQQIFKNKIENLKRHKVSLLHIWKFRYKYILLTLLFFMLFNLGGEGGNVSIREALGGLQAKKLKIIHSFLLD